MEKKLTRFSLTSFIALALIGIVGCSPQAKEQEKDVFKTKSAYVLKANEGGTSHNLTKISCLESIDGTKLLLATGFDDETLSTANQRANELEIQASLGYVVNETTYSGISYYGGILTKNASKEEKVWTAADIFGETNKNHLIVKEIDYVQTGILTINAFIKVGEEVIAEANRSIDFASYWGTETLDSNWSYSGEIAPVTSEAQGYLVQANSASTTISNFVKIPTGAKYFKFGLLTFGGVAPKVTVKLNNSLVKAVGATEDYVTPAVSNNTQIFAYDLGSLKGNVAIDIIVESTAPGTNCTAFFPSVGFSEFAYETNHVSNLTKWSKGQMCLDWTIVGAIAGNTIAGYGNGCYHLFSESGFKNTLKIANATKYLTIVAAWAVPVTANGNAVTCVNSNLSESKYTYDLSAYVGQDVVIQIAAGAGQYGAFVQAELIQDYRTPDEAGYWGTETLDSNWSWSGEIAPITNQAQGYLVEANSASTTISNFVTIPQGKSYFKFSVMKFGDAIANPNIKVYVKSNGVTSLVKAVGYDTDYVQTPEGNLVYIYAYDLSSYSGAVSIKIEATNSLGENGVNIALQSIGFSEYGKNDHTSTLTSWSDAQIYTDWNSDVMSIRGDDTRCWPALATNQELTNTISITSQLNALKINGSNVSNLKVYVNDGTDPIQVINGSNCGTVDLSSYIGQSVKIRLVGNGDIIIKSMEQFNYLNN